MKEYAVTLETVIYIEAESEEEARREAEKRTEYSCRIDGLCVVEIEETGEINE